MVIPEDSRCSSIVFFESTNKIVCRGKAQIFSDMLDTGFRFGQQFCRMFHFSAVDIVVEVFMKLFLEQFAEVGSAHVYMFCHL